MTPKQQRFCDEYLVSGNGTEAAVKAGYSEKTAYSIGSENLKKPELKEYLEQELEKLHSVKVADAREVIEYLTSVMRGESTASVLAMCGDGRQKIIEKNPDERERLRAAELIGKRYSLFTDKVGIEGAVPVMITGDDQLED